MLRQVYAGIALVMLAAGLLAACGGPPAVTPATTGTVPMPASTSTPSPLPVGGGIASPTRTPAPAVLPTRTGSPAPAVMLAATATSLPAGTPTAVLIPQVVELGAPLVVDSEAGRLYVPATVDSVRQIVALAATEGRLVTTYGVDGPFAVDGVHGHVYVDRDAAGLTVLDAETAAELAVIALPGHSNASQRENPAPQADPATGEVLAFRDNVVRVAGLQGVIRTIPFDVPRVGQDCRTPDGPLPIEWAAYDGASRILYLDFQTYVCTPWIGHTLLSYDMASGTEIARRGIQPQFSATVSGGALYGSSWYRMGDGFRWAWRDGQPDFESSGWGYGAPAFYVDAARGRLYAQDAGGLHVFDARTMALIMIAPLPGAGALAGYDPGTDQLYFFAGGGLQRWSPATIRPPAPQPLAAAQPPATAVRSLIASPTWEDGKTLFGIWNTPDGSETCWVFGGIGGPLYVSPDGGGAWGRSHGGLPDGCDQVSALAVSPDYAHDRTLLAGVIGLGLFRSTDGGQLWEPSAVGLSSMHIGQILLSPGFAGRHGPRQDRARGRTAGALPLRRRRAFVAGAAHPPRPGRHVAGIRPGPHAASRRDGRRRGPTARRALRLARRRRPLGRGGRHAGRRRGLPVQPGPALREMERGVRACGRQHALSFGGRRTELGCRAADRPGWR